MASYATPPPQTTTRLARLAVRPKLASGSSSGVMTVSSIPIRCRSATQDAGGDHGLRPTVNEQVGGLASREQLMAECDVILLPKPVVADLLTLPLGKVLWGWPHCVQDERLTQVAIDRRLALIAWEAMHHWTREGNFSLHVFHQKHSAGCRDSERRSHRQRPRSTGRRSVTCGVDILQARGGGDCDDAGARGRRRARARRLALLAAPFLP